MADTHLYHFTRDGEYVDATMVSDMDAFNLDKMNRLSNTYERCQAWVYAGMWYTIPAAGLSHSRWDGAKDNDVPMCVRMAEIVRGE